MGGISSQKVTFFFRHLQVMVNAGIPIADALAYLEKGELDPAFETVIGGCHSTLISGLPLSAGLRKYPHIFPAMAIELVAVGEKTGALVGCLQQIAMLCERQTERRQKIQSALTYPLCLCLVMLIVVGLFVTVIAPGDKGMLSMLGDDVPWPSQVLLTLSRLISNPIIVAAALVFIALLGAGFRRSYHTSLDFRRLVDGWLLEAPVVGKVISRIESARSLDALGSSLSVGLGVMPALANASRTVVNQKFKDDLSLATQAIRDGEGIGVSLARHTIFPRLTTSLIQVAEASGDLETSLQRSAKMLDAEVNDALDRAVSLIEPLLLALGGAAAGFVAVATFLPIVRLVSNLG